MTRHTTQLGQIERIERALVLLAYFIELDGDVHLPMYEKFEAELAELKAAADVKARAAERLAAFRQSGERRLLALRAPDVNSTHAALPHPGPSG